MSCGQRMYDDAAAAAAYHWPKTWPKAKAEEWMRGVEATLAQKPWAATGSPPGMSQPANADIDIADAGAYSRR